MQQNPGFSEDQKEYLEGFIAALARKRGMPLPNGAAAPPPPAAETTPSLPSSDPSPIHIAAQDRALAAGGKLA